MQQPDSSRILPRALLMVTREEDQAKIDKILSTADIPIYFQARGLGTAPSEIMDILGLSGGAKQVTMGFLPKYMVKPVFETLNETCSLRKRGHGIAVTIPISGIQNHMLRVLKDEAREAMEQMFRGDEIEMKEKSEYSLIWVSVKSGYSDDVVDAARAAGAKGGTVMKGRRRNSERIQQLFGISVQDEQDFVMIIVPKARKAEIMSAISAACGTRTGAHGVVISLPIDDALGLEG